MSIIKNKKTHPLSFNVFQKKKKFVLEQMAIALSIPYQQKNTKQLRFTLINASKERNLLEEEIITAQGMIEIHEKNEFGFLRLSCHSYLPHTEDIYITSALIQRYLLRHGETVVVSVQIPNEKIMETQDVYYSHAMDVLECASLDAPSHHIFEELTTIFPLKRFNLSIPNKKKDDFTLRVIDIFAPIGFGQRCLIVAPPKVGKTVLMTQLASAIEKNHPEAVVMMVLIDERPEEVTDAERTIAGEVLSSTFDEAPVRHMKIADMALLRAKRLVEEGKDVVIFLDSLTRLARANNSSMPSSGKILTGGFDSKALQKPKQFFGAARCMEEGGSLTIIATVLVDTGSKMDELVYEELKGTGNAEIVLDRKLAQDGIYPAINTFKTGVRKEELLVDKDLLNRMWHLRRYMNNMTPQEALLFLFDNLRKSTNNIEFFSMMNR
jgi:transcription termination factor Rho